MSNFNHIYKSILTEGRIPSIFRKATPEELAERKVQWEKIQVDEWMENFLRRKDIRKNKDGSWDVDGEVDFSGMKGLIKFPVKFGVVGGPFDCTSCSNLESLEGAPTRVTNGGFYCSGCKNLKSLKGAPTEVISGDNDFLDVGFMCADCISLTSLEGAPANVTGEFMCCGCTNLISLEGSPSYMDGSFTCAKCANLKSLKGCPTSMSGNFDCSDCGRKFTVEEVEKHCPQVEGDIHV